MEKNLLIEPPRRMSREHQRTAASRRRDCGGAIGEEGLLVVAVTHPHNKTRSPKRLLVLQRYLCPGLAGVLIVVTMIPAIMVMIRPAVTMLHGNLIATCKRVTILVAMHTIRWRTAEHHRAVSVQGAARLPVIVGRIHAVMESATVHVVEVWWRSIPPLTVLVALLLRRRPAVLLCMQRDCGCCQ